MDWRQIYNYETSSTKSDELFFRYRIFIFLHIFYFYFLQSTGLFYPLTWGNLIALQLKNLKKSPKNKIKQICCGHRNHKSNQCFHRVNYLADRQKKKFTLEKSCKLYNILYVTYSLLPLRPASNLWIRNAVLFRNVQLKHGYRRGLLLDRLNPYALVGHMEARSWAP